MATIKCDKLLCKYNYSDVCTNAHIELMNGKCLECKEEVKDTSKEHEITWKLIDLKHESYYNGFDVDLYRYYLITNGAVQKWVEESVYCDMKKLGLISK